MATDAPTSTVEPPVKLEIANAVPSEIVIMFPADEMESPDPTAIVRAGPVSVLTEVMPPPPLPPPEVRPVNVTGAG